jgi:hypothetical protein
VSATSEHRSLRSLTGTGSLEPLLRCPWSGISGCEEIERGGTLMRISVTRVNSAQDS